MELKEYLLASEFFRGISYGIIKLISELESERFFRCADAWFENPAGGLSFESVSDMFSYYMEENEEVKLKLLMEKWWGTASYTFRTYGERLNGEIIDFYKDNFPDTPVEKIPCFDRKSFGSLFEEETVEIMKPDFYSYFNPSNKTFIRFDGLPRVKYFPWCISRRRVIGRIDNNRNLIRMYIQRRMISYYGSCVVAGKRWEDYIIELVAERVCGF